MKLSELFAGYGDDNIVFQTLDTDITNMSRKKTHNELTFGTHQEFDFNGTSQMGLVVWLDRDKVDEIMRKDKE